MGKGRSTVACGANRAPPTGTYTEDGRPVLFHGAYSVVVFSCVCSRGATGDAVKALSIPLPPLPLPPSVFYLLRGDPHWHIESVGSNGFWEMHIYIHKATTFPCIHISVQSCRNDSMENKMRNHIQNSKLKD